MGKQPINKLCEFNGEHYEAESLHGKFKGSQGSKCTSDRRNRKANLEKQCLYLLLQRPQVLPLVSLTLILHTPIAPRSLRYLVSPDGDCGPTCVYRWTRLADAWRIRVGGSG